MPQIILVPRGDPIGVKTPLKKGDRFGFFDSTTDIIEAEKQNLLNLLMTMFGERVIHYNLGIGVQENLFENMSIGRKAIIRERISQQVNLWLPHLKILKIDVLSQEDEAVLGYNDLKISLGFQLLDNPDMFDTVQVIITP